MRKRLRKKLAKKNNELDQICAEIDGLSSMALVTAMGFANAIRTWADTSLNSGGLFIPPKPLQRLDSEYILGEKDAKKRLR